MAVAEEGKAVESHCKPLFHFCLVSQRAEWHKSEGRDSVYVSDTHFPYDLGKYFLCHHFPIS